MIPITTTTTPITGEVIPGTAGALKNPPTTADEVLAYLRKSYATLDPKGKGKYLVPLVWTADPTIHCWWARLVDEPKLPQAEINHISVTGSKNTGKDSFLLMMCLILALQHGPDELEFFVVDGKGDLILLSLLQATRACAINSDQIPGTLEAINEERKRRQAIINKWSLEHKRTYKWETLPEDIRKAEGISSLVVVVISEILLLKGAFDTVREFENRLTEILVACRSAGMRVFLSGQKFNGMGTAWRTQPDIWASSAQAFASDDEPNLGSPTATIKQLGLTPPSQLDPVDHKGVFTVMQASGKVGATGRTTHFDGEEVRKILERLPLKQTSEVSIAPEKPEKPETDLERAVRIIKENPGLTQSEYEMKVFNYTGGQAWQVVRRALEQIKSELTQGEK